MTHDRAQAVPPPLRQLLPAGREGNPVAGRRRRRFGLAAALLLGLSPPVGIFSVAFFGLWTGSGCGNRAGMTCQQQSDCSAGLLCNKPPSAGSQSYGICEPGLQGLGEVCVSSAECDPNLLCSTEVGVTDSDGWHGVCQQRSEADAAAPDLSAPADLRMAGDLAALDGGADL